MRTPRRNAIIFHSRTKRAKLATERLHKRFVYRVNDVARLARSPIILFFNCDIDDDSTKFLHGNGGKEKILRIKTCSYV